MWIEGEIDKIFPKCHVCVSLYETIESMNPIVDSVLVRDFDVHRMFHGIPN